MSLASQVSLAITAIGVQIKALRVSAVQPGDYIYSAATSRAGCLPCTGGSYLRTDYPALFTALGGTSSPYGLPDNTHFNVPNVSGRFLVAAGLSGANGAVSKVLSAAGGEETHVLITGEMPVHTHTVPYTTGQAVASGAFTELINTGSPNATFTSGSAGSGNAHNNMPPYIVANAFIKT